MNISKWLEDFGATARSLFNLRADTDEKGTIENIRANVDFKSANAWTLIFAIIIASVGLNTNSAAAIIGAMLISPLMGPIVGAGLGLGINDLALIKRSGRNLGYAVGISILASTIYFLISPNSEVQSELLARTRPTFFDVLIAMFGGAAGIVALSRQEKSNAIPGVAIATALMPPLCTAGFGLATGELSYFFGAIYLFVINCVFICISTLVFVRYLKFQKVVQTDANVQRKIDRWVLMVSLIVVVPSLILGWLLQRESSFHNRARNFITKEMKFDQSFVVGQELHYEWSKQRIRVTLIGEPLSAEQMAVLKERALRYQLTPDSLEIKQSSLAESLDRRISERLNTQDANVREKDVKLAQAELELQKLKASLSLTQRVTDELITIFPQVMRVNLQDPAITIQWKARPSKADREKADKFIRQRVEDETKAVEHSVSI